MIPQVSVSEILTQSNACLFDCDTAYDESVFKNVFALTMERYDNTSGMKKGIENALILTEIEIDQCYNESIKPNDYGGQTISKELNKAKLCDYICSLDAETKKKIYQNLFPVIDKLAVFFSS